MFQGFAVSLLIIATQTGCVRYLVHAGYGQIKILTANIPISEAIDRKKQLGLSELDVAKLREVLSARQFAIHTLGLSGSGNYTKYKQLDRKYIAYQVSASEKLRLQPYYWRFPIVGRVPYLGFFSKDMQLEEGRRLEALGLDVRYQNVIAYSTLGWFNDPLNSSMLLLGKEDLINTIFHELSHATIFFPGDVDFNEGAATFLADTATVIYIRTHYADPDAALRQIEAEKHDRKLFATYIRQLIDELKAVYANDELSRGEKLARKKALFRQSRRKMRRNRDKFQTTRYFYYFDKGFHPNNAHLLAYRRYFLDLSLFERGYRAVGKDFRRYVAFLKNLGRTGTSDYKAELRRRIDKMLSRK